MSVPGSIAALVLSISSHPTHAAERSVFSAVDCAIAKPSRHQPFGLAAHRGTTPAQTSPASCPTEDDSADTWIMLLLLAGGVVIGVPAARRHNGRVVFS